MEREYHRPEGFPSWVSSVEDEGLYGAAVGYDASHVILSSRASCTQFVSVKKTIAQTGEKRLAANAIYPISYPNLSSGAAPRDPRIAIPSADRPWRSLDQLCPILGGGRCPRDKLVDVENAVSTAVDIVAELKDKVVRVPPIVIARLTRGGKTTLIDLISKKLSENSEYYVVTITTMSFIRCEDESWLQALVRLIAYQLVETNNVTDTDTLFRCKEADLLNRLQEINDRGRTVILLVDELNKLGVPLDTDTSVFLTTHFLDKKGRYLIFSSHVQFRIDDPLVPTAVPPTISTLIAISPGRKLLTLPLPFCADRKTLETMLEGSVTDLSITLAVGIPSFLYVMSNPRGEMSFQERFDNIIGRHLGAGRRSRVVGDFVAARRATLLDDFLSVIINGTPSGTFFEMFSTPTDEQQLRFPLPYIPIILGFLEENDSVPLFDSLKASAETVEGGRDWELVIVFAIYIRSLACKYCNLTADVRGPFDIATDGVNDVRVITIPAHVSDVAQAAQYIQDTTQEAKTIYIFQLAYSRFPDFDGFVSYQARKKRQRSEKSPTIHGFQCKLSRGYPRRPVDHAHIARGWILRGGTTVQTPDRVGWAYPTEEDINTNLLGFGLRLLHPMTWGTAPATDAFD